MIHNSAAAISFYCQQAAACEAVLFAAILHCEVIRVGVDADIVHFALAEVNRLDENTLACAVGGNTVYCAVRLVIEPATLVRAIIERLFSRHKHENAVNIVALIADIQLTSLDVLVEPFVVRLCGAPLPRVACLSHIFACAGIDVINARKVVSRC